MSAFNNMRFVVTGAASGIGRAAASLLKERGAHIIALDLKEPDGFVIDDYIAYDQGDLESVVQAAARIPEHIDGLLNIAGAPPSPGLNPEDLLMINFYGLRSLTTHLNAKFSPGAAVINMSSHAGHRWRENVNILNNFSEAESLNDVGKLARRYEIVMDGLGDRSAYPLSKQLLNYWTVVSFPECEKFGLRMNAVSAAGVQTPILNDFLTSFGEESAARIRSIGVAPAHAIAQSLVFLVSEQSAWIKGAIIPVDSGALALATLKSLG